MTPEQEARKEIDKLLALAGWHVCDYKAANIHAARGLAIRKILLNPSQCNVGYLFVQLHCSTRRWLPSNLPSTKIS